MRCDNEIIPIDEETMQIVYEANKKANEKWQRKRHFLTLWSYFNLISLKVAEYFGKRHKDVIRAIENAIINAPKIAPVKNSFVKSTYEDTKGEQRPMYYLNRDGFSFVAMGFTGKKAAEFKWAYIQEFNRMEQELQRIALNKQNSEWIETRKDVKILYRKMTDSLKILVDYASAHGSKNADKLYIHYNRLINKNLGLKPGQPDTPKNKFEGFLST